MFKKKDKIWFSYNLDYARGGKSSSFEILDDTFNTIKFEVYEGLMPVKWGTLVLSHKIIEKAKKIISDSKAYDIEKIEQNQEFGVCDGYHQNFCFRFKNKNVEVRASNLQAYIHNIEKYPNVTTLKNLLINLSKILVPEGVDRRCFWLQDEDDFDDESDDY